MSGPARTIILVLGALCVFGGTLMLVEGSGGGAAALVIGLMLVISIAFERRYGRPGQEPTHASIDWQRTGEKFIDDETGQRIEVWMDPLTGERRYEALGSDPPARPPARPSR